MMSEQDVSLRAGSLGGNNKQVQDTVWDTNPSLPEVVRDVPNDPSHRPAC
jgi:hypothetical protein